MIKAPIFRQLFERETSTFTYLVACAETHEGILIDPVRETVDRDLELVGQLGISLMHTLETHVHADHVTGSGTIRLRAGTKSVTATSGGAPCADVHVAHGDVVRFGKRHLQVRATPGHTDGCLTYVLDDLSMAFTGDALLIRGTGRTDFQGGSAARLFASIQEQIFTLPPETRLYPGHDYRGFSVTSVDEERRFNPRVGGGKTLDEFVAIMGALHLPQPARIREAVPANLACGLEPRMDGVHEISVEGLAAQPSVRIIDVRNPSEIDETGRIPGSETIPLERLAASAETWVRGAPIVLVCAAGTRSAGAVLQLSAIGFTSVASLSGGLRAWLSAGHSVER